MHRVGTFAAAAPDPNPIELRHAALSPVNTVAPAAPTVLGALGVDGFNAPSLIGVFDSAPYFRTGAAATLEEAFGINTDPSFLPAVQAHWRAGTGGDPNILDSEPTAVTDLIAFLRTIDDRTTPFPAADLAPDDPAFTDFDKVCDCALDTPPMGITDCAP